MGTEIISGVNLSQVAAGFLHLAVLWAVQHGLGWLAKSLRVDRLSLVNDRSTKTAVVRALLTRFDLWIWGCGLYTLLAWHFNGLVSSAIGPGWATPARQVAILQAITILALSSLGGRLIRHESATARFSSRRLLPLGKRRRGSMRGRVADRDSVSCYDLRAWSSRSAVLPHGQLARYHQRAGDTGNRLPCVPSG